MSERSSGTSPGSSKGALTDLERRISAARETGKPEPRNRAGKYAAASMAWRMITELVMSVMVGAAMGWGLDALFGTLPAFLIVFVLLGFAAGVRMMLRTAEEMQRKSARGPEDEEKG